MMMFLHFFDQFQRNMVYSNVLLFEHGSQASHSDSNLVFKFTRLDT